jgi:hypothetical protein
MKITVPKFPEDYTEHTLNLPATRKQENKLEDTTVDNKRDNGDIGELELMRLKDDVEDFTICAEETDDIEELVEGDFILSDDSTSSPSIPLTQVELSHLFPTNINNGLPVGVPVMIDIPPISVTDETTLKLDTKVIQEDKLPVDGGRLFTEDNMLSRFSNLDGDANSNSLTVKQCCGIALKELVRNPEFLERINMKVIGFSEAFADVKHGPSNTIFKIAFGYGSS